MRCSIRTNVMRKLRRHEVARGRACRICWAAQNASRRPRRRTDGAA